MCSELENDEELFLSPKKLTQGLLVGVWSFNQREKNNTISFSFSLSLSPWNTLLRRHQVGSSTRESNWQDWKDLGSEIKPCLDFVIKQSRSVEGTWRKKTQHRMPCLDCHSGSEMRGKRRNKASCNGPNLKKSNSRIWPSFLWGN